MRSAAIWAACVLWAALGCMSGREEVRAAQLHLETFTKMRTEALQLIEFWSSVERERALLRAIETGEPPPPGLRKTLRQMKASGRMLTAEEVEAHGAKFDSVFRTVFTGKDVLMGEIVIRGENDSLVTLRSHKEQSLPVSAGWKGLRPQRTFAAVADCKVGENSIPCVMIQLRPRPHSGSAGLTVAFRRDPPSD